MAAFQKTKTHNYILDQFSYKFFFWKLHATLKTISKWKIFSILLYCIVVKIRGNWGILKFVFINFFFLENINFEYINFLWKIAVIPSQIYLFFLLLKMVFPKKLINKNTKKKGKCNCWIIESRLKLLQNGLWIKNCVENFACSFYEEGYNMSSLQLCKNLMGTEFVETEIYIQLAKFWMTIIWLVRHF